ncbi:hypothetical protein CENSYa_0478 [Cenarchaeum symbiosum A]|uniref:Uncharacterized protein n=1 Tax=Cenarchaeum symbiosum (strain A) TaxID=414004 RepID=A0RUU5_CENSY|nr:hypothetical protein CENSYa_0478 [Cenarchaeum symbiosum A]
MRALLAGAAIISALVIAAVVGAAAPQEAGLGETLLIGAEYDGEAVEITYEDRSGGTSSVTLEMLGMQESFRRTYDSSSFSETIPFAEPRYGWQAHPIILEIDHIEYGMIHAKTEVRPAGGPAPRVIFGR